MNRSAEISAAGPAKASPPAKTGQEDSHMPHEMQVVSFSYFASSSGFCKNSITVCPSHFPLFALLLLFSVCSHGLNLFICSIIGSISAIRSRMTANPAIGASSIAASRIIFELFPAFALALGVLAEFALPKVVLFDAALSCNTLYALELSEDALSECEMSESAACVGRNIGSFDVSSRQSLTSVLHIRRAVPLMLAASAPHIPCPHE